MEEATAILIDLFITFVAARIGRGICTRLRQPDRRGGAHWQPYRAARVGPDRFFGQPSLKKRRGCPYGPGPSQKPFVPLWLRDTRPQFSFSETLFVSMNISIPSLPSSRPMLDC